MKTTSELRLWLESFDLLHAITDSDEAIWAMLESRDAKKFDSQWLRALSDVQSLETLALSDEETAEQQAIMRLAFKKTFALNSASSGELAAYVADDFDLIARSICVKAENVWLLNLLREYQMGRFPHAKLI